MINRPLLASFAIGIAIAGFSSGVVVASNEVTVHHDAVAQAKAAFEQEMDAIENAAVGVQGGAASINPPSSAPSIPSRPNGCVRQRSGSSNTVVPFGSVRKDLISSSRNSCTTRYEYQHYNCRSNSRWERGRTSSELVSHNTQCGGES